MAHADTVDDAAFQETVDGAMAQTLVADTVVGQTSVTVLPRLELVDGAATLIPNSRPRFSIKGKLGEGGVGEVLKAYDADIGRDVAIKRLRSVGGNPTSVARFVEEMRVTGGLDHPNVVPVHDVGVNEDGEYFFVMRHVKGETLESIIGRLAADDPVTHKSFGFERRLVIFKSVLEAVAYAHSRGVIHRDIKPANIMVGPFGEVVVMDWGVAKPLSDPDLAMLGSAEPVHESEGLERAFETQAGALVGTPAYMAPEQVLGTPVDVRSDVFALSVLLYEMLYLQHYLHDCTSMVEVCHNVMTRDIDFSMSNPSKVQGAVPADLYWFVEKGMRKEPERRFQTVQEMIDRLDRRAAGEIQVQCHLTFTRRMFHEALRFFDHYPHQSFLGAVALILLLSGALIHTIVG